MSINQHLQNAAGTNYPLPSSLYIRGFQRPANPHIVDYDTGQVATRPTTYRAITGTLEGTIRSTTYAAAIAELDTLLAFLRKPPIKIRLQGATDRYLEAYPQLVDDAGSVMAHRPRISIPMVAPNPWWIGTAGSFSEAITGTVNRSVTNAGNIRTPATITLSGGSATNPSVTNAANTHTMAYIGSIINGDTLTANGERRTMTVNGANALNAAGNDFITYGFWLEPGANSLSIATGGGPITVAVAWTARYA